MLKRIIPILLLKNGELVNVNRWSCNRTHGCSYIVTIVTICFRRDIILILDKNSEITKFKGRIIQKSFTLYKFCDFAAQVAPFGPNMSKMAHLNIAVMIAFKLITTFERLHDYLLALIGKNS